MSDILSIVTTTPPYEPNACCLHEHMPLLSQHSKQRTVAMLLFVCSGVSVNIVCAQRNIVVPTCWFDLIPSRSCLIIILPLGLQGAVIYLHGVQDREALQLERPDCINDMHVTSPINYLPSTHVLKGFKLLATHTPIFFTERTIHCLLSVLDFCSYLLQSWPLKTMDEPNWL